MMKYFVQFTAILIIPATLFASSYAVDDFDDGVLDPLWTCGYENADPNYVLTSEDVNDNSMFVLTKMVPLNPAAKWTSLYLSRYLGTLNAFDDFHIDFTQTVKQTDIAKMPYVKLMLRDTSGSGYMLTAGYEDKSTIAFGYPHLWIENAPGATDDYVEYGETTGDMVLDWDITRQNGVLGVYLNGQEFIDPAEQPYSSMTGLLSEVRIFIQARNMTWQWDRDPLIGVNYFRMLPRKPQREINWTGASNSAWATASNWSDNQVPDIDTVLTINTKLNKPVLPVGNYEVLYADVNSGPFELQGTLNAYSMEVDQGGTVKLAAQDAKIILKADQKASINKLISQGRIISSVANTVVVAEYDGALNQTVIKLIVPRIEKALEWKFNDGSGLSVSDSSGKGNNGSLLAFNDVYPLWATNGGRSSVTGDHAISFTDPNATVKILNASGLPCAGSDAWTINIWVYPEGLQADRAVVAGFGDLENVTAPSGTMRYIRNVSGKIGFYGLNSSISSAEPLDINKWQMLTVTCDYAGVVTMYKNGYRIALAQLSLNNAEPIVHVSPAIQGLGFKGKIDDFSIHTYPMTQKQIVTDLWGSWICGQENKAQPAWDLNGNCIVDLADLAKIGQKWLAGYNLSDLDKFADSWLESGRVTGSGL